MRDFIVPPDAVALALGLGDLTVGKVNNTPKNQGKQPIYVLAEQLDVTLREHYPIRASLSQTLVAASNVGSFIAGFLAASVLAIFVAASFGGDQYNAGYEDGEAAVVESLRSFGATPLEDPTR
jgi:hypothetical protein